jgi:hypothetical protein
MVRLDACASCDDNISMQGINLVEASAEEYRQRIARMSDDRLIREGEAARYMCDPRIQREIRPVFVMHLGECIAEWRRRHPKTS